jgi:hypothetical protein
MISSEMLIRSDPLLKTVVAINIPGKKELVLLTNIFIFYNKMATELTHDLEEFYSRKAIK